MELNEYGRYPEHARWALKRWEEETGQSVDPDTAACLVDILLEHREILSEQVLQIKVGPVYKSDGRIRERDIAAEKFGRTMVVSCANLVLGKFGLTGRRDPRPEMMGGRPIEELPGL